jgi:N6-L-threonylcarbamoyladenine synthase
MKILGIETSCDETAAAVIENGTKIITNVVATSAQMHEATGGIIPETAARQQIKSILPVIQKSLVGDVDAIAITVGPGLIGSLLVGVETTKTLAYLWDKPIVPVNHLVGHLYANWLDTPTPPEFPALGLVVSGGHTDLVLMKGHGQIKWLGGTRDDAAGEAFDKTARLLGLGYPGGPAVAAEASKSKAKNEKLKMLPRPLINSRDFDFSFSGLKTAIARQVLDKRHQFSKDRLAAEVQQAIVDVLVEKSIRAIKKHKPKSFLLAGGVAANKLLRKTVFAKIARQKLQVIVHVPPTVLCTDNASYIAACAFYNYKPNKWQKITANPNLTITD